MKTKESLFKQIFITRTQGFIDVSAKRRFWKEMAEEYQGELHVKKTVAKDLERLILDVPYKQYNIEFSESDTYPLKIECQLSTDKSIDLFISFEDTIEKLLKVFGQQDREVGDASFDQKYLIKGKNADQVRKIFENEEIRMILLSNNVFSFNCLSDNKKTDASVIGIG